MAGYMVERSSEVWPETFSRTRHLDGPIRSAIFTDSKPSLSSKPVVQVLLDSSFILTLVKQHRDPWAEISDLVQRRVKILTLDLVVFELERLARNSSSKTGAVAKASLVLLAKRKQDIVEHKPGPTDVDSALIAHALTERAPTAIATVDREMRKVLSAQNVPVISPRARHGLIVEGSFSSST